MPSLGIVFWAFAVVIFAALVNHIARAERERGRFVAMVRLARESTVANARPGERVAIFGRARASSDGPMLRAPCGERDAVVVRSELATVTMRSGMGKAWPTPRAETHAVPFLLEDQEGAAIAVDVDDAHLVLGATAPRYENPESREARAVVQAFLDAERQYGGTYRNHRLEDIDAVVREVAVSPGDEVWVFGRVFAASSADGGGAYRGATTPQLVLRRDGGTRLVVSTVPRAESLAGDPRPWLSYALAVVVGAVFVIVGFFVP